MKEKLKKMEPIVECQENWPKINLLLGVCMCMRHGHTSNIDNI